MNNYEYCADFIASRVSATSAKVLDFGCGAGKIVALCRQRGIDAYGCDVFYEGGDYSHDVPPDLFGTVIRRMDGNRIPFESETFDWVVSNQVLEHVPDLEAAVAEMFRVVKPGGFVLSMFPDRGVWLEGHCGIPFLHWFPRGSRVRVTYAALLRKLGFGLHTEGRAPREWSENFCNWLDTWTYYRPYQAIRKTFDTHFAEIEHFEADWLAKRTGRFNLLARYSPAWLRRVAVRKLIGLVFVSSGPRLLSRT
jgi:SAM-dependent methyltransferase